jgi:hypothetical protein
VIVDAPHLGTIADSNLCTAKPGRHELGRCDEKRRDGYLHDVESRVLGEVIADSLGNVTLQRQRVERGEYGREERGCADDDPDRWGDCEGALISVVHIDETERK